MILSIQFLECFLISLEQYQCTSILEEILQFSFMHVFLRILDKFKLRYYSMMYL